MTVGDLDRAKRRALAIFEGWQRMTGCLDGSSYTWELEGIIEDAVEIGVQAAVGLHKTLEAEES